MKAPFRLKCCGITRLADGLAAVDAGFDALGFVFAPRSRRRLEPAAAAEIRAGLPDSTVIVALFMDNSAAEVRDVAAALRPDLLQFHGAEEDAWCRQFGQAWIKGVAMGDAAARPQLAAWPHAAALLLDAHVAGAVGGTGNTFDWGLVPRDLDRPWVLAGGLTPQNVAAAIQAARPWGVDVSSGVESSPGHKDPAKLRSFVAAVRGSADLLAGPAHD